MRCAQFVYLLERERAEAERIAGEIQTAREILNSRLIADPIAIEKGGKGERIRLLSDGYDFERSDVFVRDGSANSIEFDRVVTA